MRDFSVLQVLPALNTGGVERGAIDLACYLETQKVPNTITSTGGRLEAELTGKKIKSIFFDAKSKNPLTLFKRVKKLRNILNKENPSIVHARSRIPAWLVYFANKTNERKFITTFHGLHDNGFLGLKRYYNASLVKSDAIIAVSETVKQYLIQNFPKASHKITLIHRGIDTQYFTPQATQHNTVAQIVLPGRITTWKGHAYCLQAFAKLIHTHQLQAKLMIVGKARRERLINSQIFSGRAYLAKMQSQET